MAIAVGSAAVVKLVNNVLSEQEKRVRNNGPDPVFISRDPAVTATSGFSLALNAEEDVTLKPGEALYAITAATKTASVDIL